MSMEEPGDKNTNEKTRFRFWCPNDECNGSNYFHANWGAPPEMVPSGMMCPYKCGEYAEFVIDVDSIPTMRVRGNFEDGSHNPHYTTALAEAEHKWMGLQIGEAQKAVDGQDQLDGTAASPYSKLVPNYDEMEKAGMVTRDDTATSEQKQRIRDERAKLVAEDASDKIDREIEQRHIGNRHDG